MIKIDKNVPIPRLGRRPLYPWMEMEVGDSFVFPKRIKPSIANSMSYKTAKLLQKRGIQRRYVTRLIEDGVIRCWRLL